MPGQQIIGSVSVKVLPDTSKFRKEAERRLEEIEKRLEVTVQTKLDMSGASRSLLEEVRKMNQRNKALDSRKIRLSTTLSTDDLRSQIANCVRKYQAFVDSDRKRVKIQTDLVAADLKATLDEDSLDDVRRKIDRWRKRNSPITLEVKLDLSQTANIATSARLAVLTRPRTVSIVPDLDNAALAKVGTALAALSGARMLSETFGEITESLLRLDQNVPIISSLALAVAGLAGWALSAGSNLFALSSSLAQIAPLALLLPGLFGGLAIGVGTAITALLDFNKVIPGVGAQFKELRKALSNDFWTGAAEPIKKFIDVLLPQFSTGVQQTAGELGTWFGNLATSITGAFNGLLGGMFDDLAKSIAIASGGTDAFAGIIKTLAAVGTGYLPELAKWFVDISTQFNNFLEKAAADGSLKRWIDTGLSNLAALGSSLASIGGIFAAIADAAEKAGGTTLQGLATSLQSVQDLVESPAFQTGLVAVLQSAQKAMQDLVTQAGPGVMTFFSALGDTLTTILPIAGQAIGDLLGAVSSALSNPEVANGVIMMFKGIQEGIHSLTPAFAPLAVALAAIGKLVGVMAAAFGPLLGAAIAVFSNAVTKLAPVLSPIVELLGGALTYAIQALMPVFNQLLDVVVGLVAGGAFTALMAIVQALLPIIVQLGTTIGQIVTPLIAQLGPILVLVGQCIAQILVALSPLIGVLLQLVAAVLGPIVTILGNVITAVLPSLTTAIISVVQAITPLIAALVAVINFLMPVLVPVIQFVVELFAKALVDAITGVGQVINGFTTYLVGMWEIVSGIFAGDWSKVWEGVKKVASGCWEFLKGAFNILMNIGILKVGKLALTALKGVFELGWKAIQIAGSSAWAWIKTAFGLFLNELKSSPSAALSFLKSAFREAFELISKIALESWTKTKTAFGDGVKSVVNYVKQLPGEIKSGLGNVGTLLSDAGRKVIQGFIDGIRHMFGDVKGTLSELTSKLTSWKGPESLDRVILTPVGQLVIEGFLDGLESRYGDVKKSLRGFTRDIAKTDIDPLSVPPINARSMQSQVRAAGQGVDAGGAVIRQFIYNAAPGSSFSTEEEFFAAATRERAGW